MNQQQSEYAMYEARAHKRPPGLVSKDEEVRTMAENRIKVAPDVCSYTDEEHAKLNFEITIPGVKKNDIDLKIHEDSLSLSAKRKDFDYATTLSFCCPVKAGEARAKYENGLLRIEVPFKDLMEDAVKVPVD